MKIKKNLKEAYNELVYKVTWPSWSDLQSSAIVVMVSTLIIAVIIFAMDFTFRNLMELIYSIIK